MRVLALNPPSKKTDNIVRDVLYGCWCKGKRIGGGMVPPIVLLEVATVLKEDGNAVTFLDAPALGLPWRSVIHRAQEFDAVLLLSSSMTFLEDAELCEEMKRINPSLVTILFGAHATFMPAICVAHPGVDVGVKREPEYAIREICRSLKNQKSYESVPGIVYEKDGAVIENEEMPYIADLDELPIADRTMLPNVTYYNPLIKRYPYTTSITTRGCPAKCIFCLAPSMYGHKLRAFSAEKMIREVKYLLDLGYKEIYYRDETWTALPKRNQEFCRRVIEEKLDFTWIANARAGSVDYETLKLMKQAGCHYLKIGVESGDQEILNKSKKGIKVEWTQELFDWCRQLKIDTHAHCMLGMPGETHETIEKTINFLVKLSPTTMDVGICTPYPGSELFNRIIAENPEFAKEMHDLSDIDLGKLHESGKYNKYYTDLPREDLERSVHRMYRRFYLRPRYIGQTLRRIRSFSELLHVVHAGLNVLQFSLMGDEYEPS